MVRAGQNFKYMVKVYKTMSFKKKYTTEKLKKDDSTGKEAVKTSVSDDNYMLGEVLESLGSKLDKLKK